MDVLPGRISSTSLPVTVSAVRAELPAIEPAGRGRGLPLSLAQQRLWLLEQPEGAGLGHPIPEVGFARVSHTRFTGVPTS